MAGSKTINNTTPAIGAIKIQQSSYGLVLPIVWGRTRINGNLIWYGGFKSTPHTVTTQQGGKGGGAPKQTETNWTYSASVAMALCEGPLLGIRTAWRGKNIYTGSTVTGTTRGVKQTVAYPNTGNAITVANVGGWVNDSVQLKLSDAFEDNFQNRRAGTWMTLQEGSDYTCSAGVYTFIGGTAGPGDTLMIRYTYVSTDPSVSCLGQLGLDIKRGLPGQAPWSYLTSSFPAQALGYSGVAYVTGSNYALDEGAGVENHAFEVESSFSFSASIPDANPSTIVVDALTNPHYGAQFGLEKMWTTDYEAACTAQGIFMSPALTEQQSASSFLDAMSVLTNVGLVWSGGVLKFIPYTDTPLTGNGVTFTPNTTPIYDLTDDDFQSSDDDGPIEVDRSPVADSFNSVRLEYSDRANAYNLAIMEATDSADILENGERAMSVITAHWITEASVAKIVATLILQRSMFVRNTYRFKLGWSKIALEPMDLVTLTDAALGMNKLPVRILELEEDNDGYIDIIAEDFPKGSASAALYPTSTGIGYAPDFNESPGTALAPVIFEAPAALTDSVGGLELWVAAGGTDAKYGGCEVWVSLTGSNYRRAASLTGASRYGVTTSAIAAQGVAGATTETVGVTLSAGGQLLAASNAEALKLTTLCYIGGEFVAYEAATLTGAGAYTIGNALVRGAYLSGQAAHASGVPFVRCDSGLARLQLTPDYIGQTVRIKVLPFNRYGGGILDLASATEYTYTITGAQANNAPALAVGLALEGPFTIDTAKFKWNRITNAASYNVQMWAGSTLAKVREVNVGDALRFDYSVSDAKADGGPWRALTIKVQGINANGATGPLATLAVSNPQVGALTGVTLQAGVQSIAFACARPADLDFYGIQVWLSTVNGFTPDATNLVYDGPNTALALTALQNGAALVAGTAYYVKCAAYDTFDKVGLTVVTAGSATPINPGMNIARFYAYQRAATAPTLKPGNVTVDFATNTITAPAALANGWVRDIPTVNGNPLYIVSVSASGTGATASVLDAAWTTPVVLATDGPGGTGTNGTNGLNAATITIYQRSASAAAPAKPSAECTYTFATGVLSGLNNGWSQTYPALDPAKPHMHVSIVTAISASATDSVPASEFGTVQLLYDAQAIIDANAQAVAANVALEKIFSNGVLSRDEKPDLIRRWAEIGVEDDLLYAQANSLGVASTGYANAIAALQAYLTSLVPAWNDLTQHTDITRGVADAKWNDYYTAKVALLNSISSKVKADALADATTKADAARTNAIDTAAIAAQAKADLAKTQAQAYADGKVTAEEQRAIADATDKANAAELAAKNAAALDATAKANAAALTAFVWDPTISVLGNTAEKVSGGAAWDAQVCSTNAYTGGAMASARIASASSTLMIGLDVDPTANNSWETIDAAMYVDIDGSKLYAYGTVSGVVSGTLIGTWVVGDTVAVGYNGSRHYWTKNGTVIHSVAASAGIKYFFDSSFRTVGSKLTHMQFGPLSSNAWSEIAIQPNAPANNATVGADASNLKAGVGINRLANSIPNNLLNLTFAKSNTQTIDTGGIQLAVKGFGSGFDIYSPLRQCAFARNPGTGVDGWRTNFHINENAKQAVTPGQRYEFAYFASPHRCYADAGIAWYNNAGTYIGESHGAASTFNNQGNYENGVSRIGIFATAPAGAYYAMCFMGMIEASGQNDQYLFMSGFFFSEALPAQTAFTPWADGAPQDVRAIGYTGDLGATNDLSLVLTGTGITKNGNTVTRTGGGSWDASAHSRDGHTGGSYCSAVVVPGGNVMFGLNSPDDLADPGYGGIDYAWYQSGSGMHVFLSGTIYNGGQMLGTTTGVEVWGVSNTGSAIQFTKDGVVLLELTGSNYTNKYCFDSSFIEGTLKNIRFGAMSSNAEGVAANAAVSAIFDNGVLDRSEKAELVRRWAELGIEDDGLVAAASAAGVSSTAYSNAIQAIVDWLLSLSPAWDDMSANTSINRTTANAVWNNYYGAKTALMTATTDKARVNAAAAQADATTALNSINNPLVVSISNTFVTSKANSPTALSTIGTATVNISGGSGTYSVVWALDSVETDPEGRTVQVSLSVAGTVVTVRAKVQSDTRVLAQISATVSDTAGRVAVKTTATNCQFGVAV